MRYEHSQIIDLLSAGRIDAQEAERLLALTGLATGFASSLSQRLLSWLPVAGSAAVLIWQNRGAIGAAIQFLALRAAELSMLDHFHLFLPY
jgi:hypothetical protein